jgi:hypothetical protein
MRLRITTYTTTNIANSSTTTNQYIGLKINAADAVLHC